MLYVASPDFAQLRTNYLKAKDALALAQRSYTRAQDLYQHHVIAQADLEQAESVRNQAQADLQSAEQAIRVVGIERPDQLSKDTAMQEVPVLAPHRRGRRKTGFTRAADPGGSHTGFYYLRPGQCVGSCQRL